MSAVPGYSPLDSLRVANEVRVGRAALLGGLGRRRGGKIPADRMAGLLEDPPSVLLGMRVDRLLARTERYRAERVSELLAGVRITETRLVRELTARQRLELAGLLRERAGRTNRIGEGDE